MDIRATDLPGTIRFSVAAPLDAKGNPARLDGVPVWTLTEDSTNCEITAQGADGLWADVHVGDMLSASQLSINGDADLGSGVTPISSFVVINVVAGDAVGFGDIQAGPITPD